MFANQVLLNTIIAIIINVITTFSLNSLVFILFIVTISRFQYPRLSSRYHRHHDYRGRWTLLITDAPRRYRGGLSSPRDPLGVIIERLRESDSLAESATYYHLRCRKRVKNDSFELHRFFSIEDNTLIICRMWFTVAYPAIIAVLV